jgi:hypothetical protein
MAVKRPCRLNVLPVSWSISACSEFAAAAGEAPSEQEVAEAALAVSKCEDSLRQASAKSKAAKAAADSTIAQNEALHAQRAAKHPVR